MTSNDILPKAIWIVTIIDKADFDRIVWRRFAYMQNDAYAMAEAKVKYFNDQQRHAALDIHNSFDYECIRVESGDMPD